MVQYGKVGVPGTNVIIATISLQLKTTLIPMMYGANYLGPVQVLALGIHTG